MPTVDEALALLRRDASSCFAAARCTRFEFTSRGDRVPGTLLTPDDRRAPLVLLLPGDPARPACDWLAPVEQWIAAGAAVVTIDLPLLGERRSAKLSERLYSGLGATQPDDAVWTLLFEEFVRQSIADAARTLDAVDEFALARADAAICVGTGLGALIAAAFAGCDPRVKAAALAAGAKALGADERHASGSLSQFDGPVAVVQEGAAASAFAEAASTSVVPVAATGDGPEAALRALTPFVIEQLGS